jgi:hypothetical protein
MDIDIKKIEALLDEEKFDEVRTIINGAVSSEFSKEERGAALTGLASVYLQVSNAINSRYKAALEEAIDGMKQLRAAESRMNDKAKLTEVRAGLGK